MSIDLLVRYLHFLGIFCWIGALASEWTLLQARLHRRTIRQLARIDRVYGLAAIVVVGTGLLQWFALGKPAAFYAGNHILYTKVGLATLVGLLSIIPSIFVAKQQHGEESESLVEVPLRVRQFVRWQVYLMAIIPLLASLMAAGVGK